MNARSRRRFGSALPIAFFAALVFANGVAVAQPVVWCAWRPGPAATEKTALASATRQLCAGRAESARAALAALFPSMKSQMQIEGPGYDFEQAYFYALLATHRDAEARRLLAAGPALPEEHLFYDGRYADAFAALVGDDASVPRNGDAQAEHQRDPHLDAALAAVRAGNVPRAIVAMRGVRDQGSLYDLMRGDLAAQANDWNGAFLAWIAAAEDGPDYVAPEWYSPDQWNREALDRIYYYRAHAPQHPPDRTP